MTACPSWLPTTALIKPFKWLLPKWLWWSSICTFRKVKVSLGCSRELSFLIPRWLMFVWLAVKQNPENANRQISIHLSEWSTLPSQRRGWWEPQLLYLQQVSQQIDSIPVWLLSSFIPYRSPSTFSCLLLARDSYVWFSLLPAQLCLPTWLPTFFPNHLICFIPVPPCIFFS
jgi:hypothetical protein